MLAAVALALWFLPGAREISLYDRPRIGAGEGWRLWSGHFAHHSLSHLLWNVVIFFPVAAWSESIAPRTTRAFLAVTPFFISGILWFFATDLRLYAGLSGITMGVVVLLALIQLGRGMSEPRLVWSGILFLAAVKIVVEFARPQSALFAGLPSGFRNVPLAHLAGCISAGTMAFIARRRTGDS